MQAGWSSPPPRPGRGRGASETQGVLAALVALAAGNRARRIRGDRLKVWSPIILRAVALGVALLGLAGIGGVMGRPAAPPGPAPAGVTHAELGIGALSSRALAAFAREAGAPAVGAPARAGGVAASAGAVAGPAGSSRQAVPAEVPAAALPEVRGLAARGGGPPASGAELAPPGTTTAGATERSPEAPRLREGVGEGIAAGAGEAGAVQAARAEGGALAAGTTEASARASASRGPPSGAPCRTGSRASGAASDTAGDAPSDAASEPAETARARPPPPQAPVVLNRADASELRRLPGVGAKRAEAILALRQRLGRFRSPADLLRIKGIGPRTLERMRPHLVLD